MRGVGWVIGWCAVLGTACRTGPSGHPAGGPPPVPVQIDTVKATPLRDTTEYVAVLRSLKSVQIHPQVSGYLTDIMVQSGARVSAGADLMRIDPSRQRALVRSQEAARDASAAALELARRQFERTRRLFSAGAASRQDFDQAEAQLRQAQADAAATGAQAHAQAVELRYYRVQAPFAGMVGDIPVRLGDYVTPSTLLTTVDDNDVLEIAVDVPLERGPELHVGMPVEVLDASGKVVASTAVSFVSPRASSDTQSILVKASVPNQNATLRSGQFVRARLIWSERMGPAIPVLAVQNRNGQAFAWVVKPKTTPVARNSGAAPDAAGGPSGGAEPPPAGGQAPPLQDVEQRPIAVGPIQGQSYPVIRGLQVGERIVVSGIQKLRPGARVMAMGPAPAAGGGERSTVQ